MTTIEEEMKEYAENLQPCSNCGSRNVTVKEVTTNKWMFEWMKYGVAQKHIRPEDDDEIEIIIEKENNDSTDYLSEDEVELFIEKEIEKEMGDPSENDEEEILVCTGTNNSIDMDGERDIIPVCTECGTELNE